MWGHGLEQAGSVYGQVAGMCECVMSLRVPLNAGNFLTNLEPVSLSRRTLPME